jgi:hypothetical protein
MSGQNFYKKSWQYFGSPKKAITFAAAKRAEFIAGMGMKFEG